MNELRGGWFAAATVLALLLPCVAAFGSEPVAPESADAGAASEGSASEGPPNWAYQMAHDLMSPYCPGRTLAACPSPQAAELRQWILLQAAGGSTEADIEASLYERFGDEILSAPKAEGWGLSAYVVPVLGFLAGGGVIVFLLRRLAGKPSIDLPRAPVSSASVGSPRGPRLSDAELEAIVDGELARL